MCLLPLAPKKPKKGRGGEIALGCNNHHNRHTFSKSKMALRKISLHLRVFTKLPNTQNLTGTRYGLSFCVGPIVEQQYL